MHVKCPKCGGTGKVGYGCCGGLLLFLFLAGIFNIIGLLIIGVAFGGKGGIQAMFLGGHGSILYGIEKGDSQSIAIGVVLCIISLVPLVIVISGKSCPVCNGRGKSVVYSDQDITSQPRQVSYQSESKNEKSDKDFLDALERLSRLYEKGMLTEEEFNSSKTELINKFRL
ncbi:SHOCT domain-containing protein [bacterium]|nr:SHOCT domain-containing protein [bacterium]